MLNDNLITGVCWGLLISQLLRVLLVPLAMGEQKGVFVYSDFTEALFYFIVVLVICGRVLEWW